VMPVLLVKTCPDLKAAMVRPELRGGLPHVAADVRWQLDFGYLH